MITLKTPNVRIIIPSMLNLQCFRKKYTSEFWRICFNFSMMKRFVCGEHRILLLFSLPANTIDSSWRSYNIFFKILRYTYSENTVAVDKIWIRCMWQLKICTLLTMKMSFQNEGFKKWWNPWTFKTFWLPQHIAFFMLLCVLIKGDKKYGIETYETE